MTAVLWEDFLKDSYATRLGDKGSANVTKLCSFVFGFGATLMAFLCHYMDGMINVSNNSNFVARDYPKIALVLIHS